MSADIHFSGRHYAIAYHDVTRGIPDVKAMALYYILLSYTSSDRKEVHPSLSTLATMMKMSPKSTKQVQRYLGILYDLGLIRVFRRYKNSEGEISYTRDDEFNTPTSNGYVVFDNIDPDRNRGGMGVDTPTYGCQHPHPMGVDTPTYGCQHPHPMGVDTPTLWVPAPTKEIPNEEIPNEEIHTPLPPKGEQVSDSEDFKTFWETYPKRKGKEDARKAWSKLRRSMSAEAIISNAALAAQWYERTYPEKKYREQFTPYPATWLRKYSRDDWEEAVRELSSADPAEALRAAAAEFAAEYEGRGVA